MPGINKMKDEDFILVFEGNNRDRRYFIVIQKYLKENHALEILLSYSKDGIIWSIPNDVYTHENNFSKSNALYIIY